MVKMRFEIPEEGDRRSVRDIRLGECTCELCRNRLERVTEEQ